MENVYALPEHSIINLVAQYMVYMNLTGQKPIRDFWTAEEIIQDWKQLQTTISAHDDIFEYKLVPENIAFLPIEAVGPAGLDVCVTTIIATLNQ